MPRIISVHTYRLRPEADRDKFEAAVQEAGRRGLLILPGLEALHFLRGVKGANREGYASIWVYRSRADWERLWGGVNTPVSRKDYPDNWRAWEDEVLSPFLAEPPDQVVYTAYEELLGPG